MFSCEFCEISKNTFFIEHLWWLLLEDVLDDFWMSYVMYDVRPTCRVLSTYPQNWINENVLLFSAFFCVSFNLKREVCEYATRCLDGNLFRDLIHHGHCVKSAHIRSYSGPYFPAFGLNMKRHFLSLRIQSECGKIRSRITPNMDTFYFIMS